LAWLKREPGASDRLKVTVGDVRDQAMVERAVQSATEIYQFAAQVAVTTSVAEPRFDFEVNVGGTLNILEAARRSGRKPFLLFTSTNKVYGSLETYQLSRDRTRYVCAQEGINEAQPLDFYSPYGCSKGAADQYVHDYSRMYGLPTVVFRMSCIAGPRQFGNEDQGWIAHFLYSALEGKPLTIYGDGLQVRDVLCVEDLMCAFEQVRALSEETAGQIYNIGGGRDNAVSLIEVIDEIQAVTGKRIRFKTERARPGDQLHYITDFGKLRSQTGWHPRLNVRRTIELMHDWRISNQRLFEAPVHAGQIHVDNYVRMPEVAS
jgi:CDP-paratose 2-epimerase